MNLNVSLPSIGGRNEWFLIARLMVSCRIRVISTVLNTDNLEWMIRVAQPPESWLDRIQREIHQEQNNDTKLDQDFVAPALCHIPPVNCGTGHSFRGHRTMPYAYCGSECQRERERERESTSIERERLLESCLGKNGERSGRHSEVEWGNEGNRGRPKADQRTQWNVGRETGMHRWTDKIPENCRKCWELSARSGQLAREEWLFCSTRPLSKAIALFLEKFLNFERRINNDQSQRSTAEEKRDTETDSVN